MFTCRLFAFLFLGGVLCACNATAHSGAAPFGGQAATSPSSEDDDEPDDDDSADDDDAPADDDDGGPGDDDGSDESSSSGDGPRPEGGGLPCDVQDVLAANCWMCHDTAPKFGAPMPLASVQDFLVPSPTDLAQTVSDTTLLRIHDPANGMPPSGQLADADLAVLTDWIEAGAPANEADDCDDPDVPNADDVGPESLPCEPEYEFRAHAPGGGAFQVPDVDDLYMCYTFKSPFPAGAQVTAYAPIVDDERVLHHWILYKTGQQQTDGGAGPCQMPWDAQFVAGWAPGGDNAIMPDDVGLEIARPDEWLILQVHYNNVASLADAFDESGVAMCVTETPRPNLAGVLWLGQVLISIPPGQTDYPVTGTCTSQETSSWGAPFHVMSSSPHMHELGRGFRTDIHRSSGGTEVLVNEPNFSFQNQRDYPNDPVITIQPGDELVSTCYFDNPGSSTVYFGEGTSDEMCFNFVVGYPIDQIADRQCGILF